MEEFNLGNQQSTPVGSTDQPFEVNGQFAGGQSDVNDQMKDVDFDAFADLHIIPGTMPTAGVGQELEKTANFEAARPYMQNVKFNPAPGARGLHDLFSAPEKPTSVQLDVQKNKANNDTIRAIQEAGRMQPMNIGADPDPIHFSRKATNFDKYYLSNAWQTTSFHPYADNTVAFDDNMDWSDHNSLMWTQYGKMYWPAVTSSWRAIGDMFGNERNYIQGDYSGAKAFEDAMRIGGGGGFWNDALLQSAYTVGVISSIAIEELALALAVTATGAGAAPLAAARTGTNLVRGVKAVGGFMSRVGRNFGAVRATTSSWQLLKDLKRVDNARDFWRAGGRFAGNLVAPETMGAWRTLSASKNIAAGTKGLANISTTFGAFYRDFRAINLAVAEAKLEGGMVHQDLFEESYLKWKADPENAGSEPTDDQYIKIKETAIKGEFMTVAMNAPFILLTNRLTLGVALSGFKGLASMTASAAAGLGRRIIYNPKTVEGVTKAFSDGGRFWWNQMYNRGVAGNFKQLIGGGLIYGKANVGEGIQELYQEAVANGVKDYYGKVHDDPAIAGNEQIRASTIMGAESMISAQGAHVFASGFVMGGIAMVPQKAMFQWAPQAFQYVTDKESFNQHVKQRADHIKESVDTLNKMYNDPEKYFDINKVNAYVQKHMSEIMMQAGADGNVMGFHDAKDAAIYIGLNTMMTTGKSHLFKAQLEDYLSLDDIGIEEAFEAEVQKSSVEKVRTRLQESVDRIKNVEKAWKVFNDKYINPFDRNKFKEGTKEYEQELIRELGYQEAKMLMMFNSQMFERAVERYNKIYQEISKNKLIKNMSATDVDVLTSISNMKNEINYLTEDLLLQQSPDVEVTESDYTMPASIIEFEGKLGEQRPQETDKEQVKDEEGNIVQEASKGKDSNVVVKTGNDVINGKDGEYKVSWTTYRDGTTTYDVSKLEINKAGVQVVVGDSLTQAEVDALFEEKTTTKAGETISEDEYLITLSDDERAEYANKQERLSHIQKIFDILTDEKNIIEKTDVKKVQSVIKKRLSRKEFESEEARNLAELQALMKYFSQSQESQFGFFDRRKTPKVRKAILDYLNFVAGTDNAIEDTSDFDDLIKKIMDYKSLKGRSIEYGKAVNMLLNPQYAVEFGDKIALSMLKVYRENRGKVEGRLKKNAASKETNQFLNELANIGVYPVEEEAQEVLKDPEAIPTNYLNQDGPITERSNQYDRVNKIVTLYRNLIKGLIEEKVTKEASKTEKENTKKDLISFQETIDGINEEDAVSEAIKEEEERLKKATDMVEEGTITRAKILGPVRDVLKKRYKRYLKNYMLKSDDKKFMTLDTWKEQPKVKAIAQALSEIYLLKHLENDQSEFGEWLEKNRRRDDVLKVYRSKFALSYGDIAVLDTKGHQADTLSARESIKKGKNGIHIKATRVETEDGEVMMYRIVNDIGELLSDNVFYDETGAEKERTKLSKKAVPGKGFEFEGRVVHTNDIVIDKKGNHYFVISKRDSYNGKDLRVAPLDQRDAKNKTGQRVIKDGAFDTKGWKVAGEQSILEDTKKEKKQKSNTSKLVAEEALNVVKTVGLRKNFPDFYTDRLEDEETPKEATARQQKMFRDLTPQELANLTVRIGKNPGWVKAETVALEDRKTAKIAGDGYVENEQIKKHAQKYSIEVLNGDVSLGYMQGHTVMSLLNAEENSIFPEAITESEVKRLFRTFGKTGRELTQMTKAIRENYLQSQYIHDKIEKLLKQEGVSQVGASIDIKVSDLKGTSLKLMRGSEAFETVAPATFEELEYKFIDGKKTYFVMQLRGDYSKDEESRSKSMVDPITNAKANKIGEYEEIAKTLMKGNPNYIKKHFGGYVAVVMLPNGTYSFVNLKAAPMEASQSDAIIAQIKEQMIKTVEKNTTEDDNGRLVTTDVTFNHEFNDKLLKDLFVANSKIGTQVQLRIAPWGQLQVTFINKYHHEDVKGKNVKFERYVHLDVSNTEEFNKINDTEDFNNWVNAEVKKGDNFVKKRNDAVEKVEWAKFTLALKADAFKVSIPSTTSGVKSKVVLNHLMKATTSHSSEVRKGLKLVFQVDNAIGLQAISDVAKIARAARARNSAKADAEEAAIKEEQKEAEPMSDVLANAIRDGNESIPEDTAALIAQKIVADIPLSRAEVTLYTKEFIGDKVDELVINIKGKAEQNKDNVIGALEEARYALEDYRKKRSAALTLALGSKGKAWLALKKDEEYIRLKAVVTSIEKSGNFKIIKGGMSGQDVLDIEDFKVWVTENLPGQFSVEEMDELGERLTNGNMKVGEFVMYLKDASRGLEGIKGVMRVGKQTAFKKHESFHGVFRMLLTDAEIKRYLKLARKEKRKLLREEGVSLKDALDELSRAHPKYAEMTRSMLEQTLYEEHMSDQFDMFKTNPSSVPVEMRSLFQRIIDAIRAILGLERVKGLKDLYQGIESGMFANAVTRNNMFTRDVLAGSSVSANKILSIPMGTISTTSQNERTGEERLTTVQTYIPADSAQKMIFTMRNMFLRRRAASSLREEDLLDRTIDDVTKMYDVLERIDFYETRAGFENWADDLEMYHKALVDNRALVKEAVLNSLGIFVDNAEDLEDSNDAMILGLRSVADYDKSHELFGGFGKLSKEAREYIAMTILTEEDEFGNTELDPTANEADKEYVSVPVDHMRVYNLILKAVRDSKNDTEVIRKMALYVQDANNHSSAFVTSFFKDVGLTFEEVLSPGFIMPETVANGALFQSITNAFRLYRASYAIVQRDTKTGIHHVYDASKSDDENAQIKIWASRFLRMKDPEAARGSILELRALLEGSPIQDNLTDEQRSKFKVYDLEEDSTLGASAVRIARNLNKHLGMNLSPTYIKYSVIANIAEADRTAIQSDIYDLNKGKDYIEIEDLIQLLESLQKGENPYKDYQEVRDEETGDVTGFENSGIKGRVRKMALNNAQFDESVGESTFIDGEGNKIWAHQQSTYHMEKIAEINDPAWLAKALKSDSFALNNLLNDAKFETLVGKGGLIHIRAGGHIIGAMKASDMGIQTASNEGFTYGNQSAKDFLINMLSYGTMSFERLNPKKTKVFLVDDDTQEQFVVAPVFLKMLSDANSIDMVMLPVQKMVEKSDDGGLGLTEHAVDMFMKEIQNEAENIIRELNPETATQDKIEGYNTGKMRMLELFSSASILDTRDGEITNSVRVNAPSLSDPTIESIREGKQKVTLMSPAEASKVRIPTGQTSIVELITKEEKVNDESGTYVAIKNKGLNKVDKIDAGGLLESLGEGFVSTTKPEGKKNFYDFSYKGVKYYTRSWKLVDFINGKRSLYILEYNTNIESEAEAVKDISLLDKTDAELDELLKKATESEDYEVANSIKNIQSDRASNVLVDILNEEGADIKGTYTINTNVKDELRRRIVEEKMTWEQAIKEKFVYEKDSVTGEEVMLSLREVIEKKQMQELNDFMAMLHENNAMSGLPSAIKRGLREVQDDGKGGISHIETDETKALMPLFNFEASDRDFNIAQVFFNQSINARSFNNLLTPNPSMSFKDMFVDFTKRAKASHAAGTNFATEIYDKKLGVYHKVKDIDVLTITDPEFKKMFDNLQGKKNFKGKPGESADAQMVMTSKAYRYTAFADGRLSLPEVLILDKVDAGIPLTPAEIHGTRSLKGGLLFTTSQSAEKRQQWINKLLAEGDNVTVINIADILAEIQGQVEPSALIPMAYAKAEANAVTALKAGKLVVFDSANETTEGIVLRDVITKNIKKQLKQNIDVYHENIDNTKVEGLEGVSNFDIKAVETRGLKKLDAFMNSKKFVYADGQTYLKMSVLTLTKELTSVRVGERLNEQTGKIEVVWRAREGREKWHILREKLEAHESEVDENGNLVRETLGMAIFESGSKMMKKNVMDHKEAFTEGVSITDNMNTLDARWMRRQMINPSNKVEIIDPTQMKHILPSEQLKGVKVTIGSKEMTIGDVMKRYHKTTSARIDNKYFGRRNLVFSMETALREIGNSKALGKATVNLKSFMDYAISGLEASQARTQMLAFFATENGEPVFNLNNTITERKFEELFLSFFSKDVLSERQTGISVALASSYGYKLIKKVVELDEKGQPKRWDVIRSDVWEAMKTKNSKLEVQHKEFSNYADQLFVNMKVGDIYLDVLRHDVMGYDSKGKETGVKYSEFIMPSHFRELSEWLLRNDGVIPPEVAKAFGIRIPSQDDHSAINLRMVDTMPAIYGSTGIFSNSLIEISGADFDIDKLYMQIAEFYEKGGEFFEYGKAKTLKGQYKEYIRYTIKEYGNRKSAVFMATEQWSDVGNTVPVISERTIETFNKKSGEQYTVEEIMASDKKIKAVIVHQILEQYDDLSEEQIAQLFERSEDLRGGMEKLGLPVTYQEYTKYRADKELEWSNNTKLGDYTGVSEPYTGAQSNDILDYKMALLGNKGKTEAGKDEHVPSGYQAADLVPLEDLLENKLKNDLPDLYQRKSSQAHDPYSMLGMGVYFKVGKEFSRGIGSIVAPNVLLNVLSEHEISLISRKGPKGNELSKGYMLNGTEYRSFVQKFALHHNQGSEAKENPEEYRKQYVISSLITAMTDNAKEQIAGRLGIVKESLPTLGTMLGMGVDVKTAIYMLNHPSIEHIYGEVGRKNKFEAGFDKRLADRIKYIKETLENQKNKLGQPAVTTELLIAHINKVGQLNSAESSSVAGYTKPYPGSPYLEMDKLDMLFDLSVLEAYQKVRGYTAFLRNASTIINITKGLGQDTSTIEDIRMASEELGLDLTDKEMKKSELPFDLRGVFNVKNTMQGHAHKIVKEFGDILLPKVLLNQTSKFLKLRESLMNNLSQRRDMRGEDRRKLSSEATKYLNAKAYIQWLRTDSDNKAYVDSLHNGFIYDVIGSKLTIESVVTDILGYLERSNIKNSFIQDHVILLNTKHEDNRTGLSKLFTNSWTTLPDAELVRLQNSMIDLYADPATRTNVMHIVHYILVKDGMQYSNESFLNVIPPSLLQHQLNSIDKVHELFLEDEKMDKTAADVRYKTVFNATFEELQFEFIRGFTTSVSNSRFNHQMGPGAVAAEIEYKEIELGENEINIDYGQEESDTNTQLLSNKAKRSFSFTFNGTSYRFGSVMHAYEVLKTGTYNKKLDEKYQKEEGYGAYFKSKLSSDENPDLLKQLIIQSIRSNAANVSLMDALIENRTFTITEKSMLNGATIEALKEARKAIVYSADKTEYVSRDAVSRASKNKERVKRSELHAELLDEGLMTFDLVKKFSHFVGDGKLSSKEQTHKKEVKKMLRKAGLKSVEGGGNAKDVKLKAHFPYVITVKAEDKRTGGSTYRTYKLIGVVEAGESEENMTLITPETMGSDGKWWGVKAAYEATEHLGSRQQKGPAYVYPGEIPAYNRLREIEDLKSDERRAFGLGNKTLMGAFGNDISFLDKLIDAKNAKLAFAEDVDIDATDRKITEKGKDALKASGFTATTARPDVNMDDITKDELLEDYSQKTGEVLGGTSEVDIFLKKESLAKAPSFAQKAIAKTVEAIPEDVRLKVIKKAYEGITATFIANSLNLTTEQVRSIRTYYGTPDIADRIEYKKWKDGVTTKLAALNQPASEVSDVDKSNIDFLKGQNDDSESTSEKDTTAVREYLESLSSKKVFELSDKHNVNNMKGLIAIFEEKTNLDTAEEFIQRLKDNC